MTEYHSKYLAHALTLKHASCDIENLTRSIANARVDLNPHQVRAALFALQSPLSKGVILADEVGLGKTIEAGLVIAQRWAERKRHILLIVPAFLRKQWEQELRDKFFLPVKILDSKKLKEEQIVGESNPFNTTNHIVICSYSFAVDQSYLLKNVNWNLAVIDEAHRLRNVYKSSNKQAKSIAETLAEVPKLLLTATPLQNNLMELYGLVSIIDPHTFGDPESFRCQFVQSKGDELCYHQLRERLRPIAIRTLRKQVQGYVSFTNRRAFTQPFYPTDDEQRLYDGVSAYLQKEQLHALPSSQRQLITMVLRKLLASSPTAVVHTLKSLVSRLEKQGGPEVILDPEEQELLETLSEDWQEDNQISESKALDSNELTKKKQIREEIEELRSYIDLAENIRKNTKSEALLSALQTAFEQAEKIGAPKKVVVFTESKRTQRFLFEFLSNHGFQNQLVLINGTNTDECSKEIYTSWLKEHGDSDRATGSKAVDIKAALVDRFREQATILLATEAAAEGVNLQFCSLIINYDLPWNPQRVEQRIGRCHRYGQKHDVVVVNFINQHNEADQRVYDLLNDKFKLFDGVFGASDEVLGAIESGVDIEKRIAQVYQICRTTEEIREAFDQLRHELDVEIQANYKEAKSSIFEHLDEEVVSLLKMQHSETESSLNRREQWLFQLLCHELGESIVPDMTTYSFTHKQTGNKPKRSFLNWRLAEEHGGHHLREDDPFVQRTITKALNYTLSPAEMVFDYSTYSGKISLLESLVGQSGWLELSHLKIDTFETVEFLISSAKTDAGEVIAPEICEKLFQLPATIIKKISDPVNLESIRKQHQQDCLQQVEDRVSKLYDQEVEKLDGWSEDLKIGLERQLKELEKEIKEARKSTHLSKSLTEKLDNQKRIKTLENQRSAKRRSLYSEQDRIEERRDELISRLEKRIAPRTSSTPLFTIRWAIK
jgi:adenine-specific DNA-methyltransferase